ncbi:tyrosine-type recombinase/integrase [Virgibacillus flavescens]|uniref:tyrosine-type recombinase/integrase n=1 Tax=Virgibacillus flavescens TaxID=1611422 RepID=UPI003D35533F
MKKTDNFYIELQMVIKETKCVIIQEELLLFLNKHKSGLGEQINGRHIAFFFLVFNLRSVDIKEIDWEICTKLHNKEMYEELVINKENLPSSIKNKVKNFNKVYTERKGINGLYVYQKYINDFYRDLYNHLKHEYINIFNIKKYEQYLVSNYRIDCGSLKGFKDKGIADALSNFPLNKNYTSLTQVFSKDYTSLTQAFPNEGKRNYWLNTDSKFIRNIIENYLHEYAINYLHPKEYRVVGYYFIESVNNYHCGINSFLDIDDEFLEYQFEYFQNIPKDIISLISPSKPSLFINQLVSIYRLLFKDIEDPVEDNFGLSKEYINVLKTKKGYKVFRDNYKPMYFNPFEPLPNYDKIAVLANEYTSINARVKNFDIAFLDFSNLSKSVRNDILEFIWYGKGSFNERIKFNYLHKNFYKFLQKNSTTEKLFIEHNLLYKYRKKMEMSYSNSATLKSTLKSLRSILKYHQKKYGVTSSMMKVLNLNNLERTNGGNPISDNDLKVIYDGFKKYSSINELQLMIFELFTLTNLRIGEILNLERDCIESKDSTGKANIRYLSKSSNGEYISQLMSEKITYIIEKSIKLTSPHVYNNSHLSNYIFIEPVQRNMDKKLKIINFTHYFNKVLKEVKDRLENENYTVNNLRHTYIHNVYKEGTKLNYSLPKLAEITNNGYKTAKMYYRKYNDIEMYVEALSGITLSEVDINGEILKVQKIDLNNSVKNNLGQCKENTCVFDANECLICPHFVTFTNRIPKFEKKIEELKELIINTENPIITEEAISQKKLLSRYLHNMLLLEENSNGNA